MDYSAVRVYDDLVSVPAEEFDLFQGVDECFVLCDIVRCSWRGFCAGKTPLSLYWDIVPEKQETPHRHPTRVLWNTCPSDIRFHQVAALSIHRQDLQVPRLPIPGLLISSFTLVSEH